MKKSISIIFLLTALAVSAIAQPAKQKLNTTQQKFWNNIPKHINWTNDLEKIFTAGQKHKLDSVCNKFEKQTTIEISIITLDRQSVGKENFDSLVLHIAKTWSAEKVDKSNGILIGISKGMGKVRIQKSHGVAQIIDNAETDEILNKYMMPYFEKGDHFEGTLNGLTQLIDAINKKLK